MRRVRSSPRPGTPRKGRDPSGGGAPTVRMDRLFEGVEVVDARGDVAGTEVTSIEFDSRLVTPGSLFFCLPGHRSDGHDFAAAAVDAGAVGLMVERPLAFPVAQVVVAGGTARSAMARAACTFYDNPARSLVTVGVTGTNGKTTVTHLLASILDHHGQPCAVIGTLDGVRTTPEAPVVQRILDEARRSGRRSAAMEVSSHALTEARVDGIRFDAAVFTNLSHDHLDHHGTMDAYFAAKASLFTAERAVTAVVNVDDEWGRRLVGQLTIPVVTFSSEDGTDVETGPGRTSFVWRGRKVEMTLTGAYHVANALAAATTASVLGVPEDTVVRGLEGPRRCRGGSRWSTRRRRSPCVVDYAHTPDGLAVALDSARRLAGGHRVLCVFGCGGDRDRAKRPVMGEIGLGRCRRHGDHLRQPATRGSRRHHRRGRRRRGRRRRGGRRTRSAPGHRPGGGAGPTRRRRARGRQGPRDRSSRSGDRRLPFDDRQVAAERRRRRGGAVISLMASGGIALWMAVLGTPMLLGWLRRRSFGQPIREDGPTMHQVKAGTPTMGGVALVGAGVAGYLIAHAGTHVAFSRPGILVVTVMIGAAGIGFVDDWIKVRHQRSLGLNKRAKFGAQILMALGFALAAEHWAGVNTHLSFTRWNSIGIDLGQRGLVGVGGVRGGGNGQRRQPHRRARRPGVGIGHVLLRHPGHHRLLAVPSLLHLPRDLGTRPGPHLRRAGRGLPRLPVVERGAGPDLHGGHRFAGHRRRTRRLGPADEPAAAPARDRRAVRHRHPVGRHPGDQLPGVRPAGLSDGTPAPPFRASRLARDHGDRALLDPGRPVRRPGPRPLLRRLPVGHRARCTDRRGNRSSPRVRPGRERQRRRAPPGGRRFRRARRRRRHRPRSPPSAPGHSASIWWWHPTGRSWRPWPRGSTRSWSAPGSPPGTPCSDWAPECGWWARSSWRGADPGRRWWRSRGRTGRPPSPP